MNGTNDANAAPLDRRWLVALAAGVIALAILPLAAPSPVVMQIIFYVLLFGALGSAWNLVGGYLGRVSFGHSVFLGVGGYTTLLLMHKAQISPWIGVPVGALTAGLLAYIVGRPTLRLAGHYFAMATIALLEIARILFINWPWAGGAVGIETPITDSVWMMTFHDKRIYYWMALVLAVITFIACLMLTRIRTGYYWRAISGDEAAARSLGVPTERFKMRAFVISAVLTGLWGGFFFIYVGFLDPESAFSLTVSVQIVLVVILGGLATLSGPWLGAALLIPLAEGTRIMLGASGRGVDLLIYGLAILAVTLFRPQGLVSLLERLRTGKSPDKSNAGR